MKGSLRVAALLLLAACDGGQEPCADQCKALAFTTLERVAGQPGGAGWVDGVGSAVHFSDPFALTLASDGEKLFLADGSTIRVVEPASGKVHTLAGSFGMTGGDDGVGAAATFYQPSALVAGDGVLYVADTENHTIRKIDVASAKVTTIAGMYGVNGAADGVGDAALFREPEGLALGDGVLYIADTDNNTIRRMDVASGEVVTIAGTAGVVGHDDGVAAAARFAQPKAILLDDAGNLYIVDSGNTSLRKLALADGTVSTVATFDTDPTSLALDGADLLLTLDQRVVRLVLATGKLTTVAGATNQLGFVDATGAEARFSQHPRGLLNDGKGGVIVADEGNYVLRRLALDTGEVTTFIGAHSAGSDDGRGAHARFRGPQGMVIDASGIAYVADTNNHTLRKVVMATGEVSTIAGAAGQLGNTDADGVAARFNQPSGVALDEASHVLYVADAGNAAIRKLELASGAVTTLSKSGLSRPVGLALAGDDLFITDSGNHTLLSLDTKTHKLHVLAGTAMSPGSMDGTGSAARFYSPSGIVADGGGNLFVADLQNDAIRKVVVATGKVTTLAGALAVQGSNDGAALDARFAYPSALALDAHGQLFVGDTNNNVVRELDLAEATVTTVVGTPARSGVRLGALPAQLTAPSALTLTADATLVIFSENALLLAH